MPPFESSFFFRLLQARELTVKFFHPILNDYKITEQQWRIMRVLASNDIVDFQDLARQTCILPPSLTGILTRMERDGLVIKLKPTKDQRRVFVKLTSESLRIYSKLILEIGAAYKALENQLGTEKLEQVSDLLHEISQLTPPSAQKVT